MKSKITIAIILFISILTSCTNVKDGYDVLSLMKEKYSDSHIQNMMFSQHVKEYENDSVIYKTIWHEAYSAPGNLIIKMDSFTSGNGYVFNQDTLYILNNNNIDHKVKELNILVLLGFDVYSLDAEVTSKKLIELGYDLSKFCITKLDNRDVYCIGVTNESEESNKFYIDKENLYFIKYVKYSENGVTKVKFSDYKIIDKKYVATKILFYYNDKLTMSEEYFDIRFPKDIDLEIFNAHKFKEANW